MEYVKCRTSIGQLISAIDEELLDLNITNDGLRNKLISAMLTDIMDKSYIVRNGVRF